MPQWLVVSIVLSIVATVVVNLVLWLFPGAGRRLSDVAGRMAEERGDGPRARVIVPWKAMLIASIVLTVALNVLLLLAR